MTKEKVRKEIHFSPAIAKKLVRRAKISGLSQSEIVEQAVKEYFGK